MRLLRRKAVIIVSLLLFCFLLFQDAGAQCSVCTRTAQQLGEKPARGLNAGIIYLAVLPIALIGFFGYRWWKNEKEISYDLKNHQLYFWCRKKENFFFFK